MTKSFAVWLLLCAALYGCANSSEVRTSGCPAGYKWNSVERFCAPA